MGTNKSTLCYNTCKTYRTEIKKSKIVVILYCKVYIAGARPLHTIQYLSEKVTNLYLIMYESLILIFTQTSMSSTPIIPSGAAKHANPFELINFKADL